MRGEMRRAEAACQTSDKRVHTVLGGGDQFLMGTARLCS